MAASRLAPCPAAVNAETHVVPRLEATRIISRHRGRDRRCGKQAEGGQELACAQNHLRTVA
jgi:hypothetical protein